MSNVVAFNPSQVPEFAKTGALSPLAKTLAGGGGGQSGKRISIKGGVFRLISDGKEVAAIEDRFLDVVVVAAASKISRTYYGEAYNPDNPAPPACWSADGEKPDASAKEPSILTALAVRKTSKVLVRASLVPAGSRNAWLWFWLTTLRVTCFS